MTPALRWLAPALLCATTAAAQPTAIPLPQTEFYTATVHGCRAVDLAQWHHPTRQVLTEAGATLAKVELCNEDRFPVFTVRLPFDPEGQTDAFYNRLCAKLALANGFWSYALVDTADDVIIVATVDKPAHQVTLGYEHFSSP